MTEIPGDVMKAAGDVVVSLGIGGSANPNPDGFTIRNAIARAILAEREAQRERDAKIAEATPTSTLDERVLVALAHLRQSIAAAIRTPA